MSHRKIISRRRAKQMLERGYWVGDTVIARHRLMDWMAERGYAIVHDPIRCMRGIQRAVTISGWDGDGTPDMYEGLLRPTFRPADLKRMKPWRHITGIIAA